MTAESFNYQLNFWTASTLEYSLFLTKSTLLIAHLDSENPKIEKLTGIFSFEDILEPITKARGFKTRLQVGDVFIFDIALGNKSQR